MGMPRNVKDEVKAMAEGFRWGRRPLVPSFRRRAREAEGRPRLPLRLGSDGRRGGCEAGTPERSDAPHRSERAHPPRVRPGQPRRRRATVDLLLEPLEPSGRHAHHVHPARLVAGQDRGGSGARLLLRRVVASGVHGARLRRVPDRPDPRGEGRGRQGARAPRRGVEHRRLPRGHALSQTVICSGSDTAPHASPWRPGPASCPSRSSARSKRCRRDGSGRVRADPPSPCGTASPSGPTRAKRTRICLAG